MKVAFSCHFRYILDNLKLLSNITFNSLKLFLLKTSASERLPSLCFPFKDLPYWSKYRSIPFKLLLSIHWLKLFCIDLLFQILFLAFQFLYLKMIPFLSLNLYGIEGLHDIKATSFIDFF